MQHAPVAPCSHRCGSGPPRHTLLRHSAGGAPRSAIRNPSPPSSAAAAASSSPAAAAWFQAQEHDDGDDGRIGTGWQPAAVRVEEEDYTWMGDEELDAWEEEDDDDLEAQQEEQQQDEDGDGGGDDDVQVVLNLTRPSLLPETGSLLSERLLQQAMRACYQGQHTRLTRGERRRPSRAAEAPEQLPPVPPRHVGAVRVAPVAGKGWGLLATDVVQPGETLLISEPLALRVNGVALTKHPRGGDAATPLRPPTQPQPAVAAGGASEREPAEEAALQGLSGEEERAALVAELQRLQAALPADHSARLALCALWRGPAHAAGALNAPDADVAAAAAAAASPASGAPLPGRALPEGPAAGRGDAREAREARRRRLLGGYGARVRGQLVPDLRTWLPAPERDPQEEERAWSALRDPGSQRWLEGLVGEEGAQARELSGAELQGVVRHCALVGVMADPAVAVTRNEPQAVASGLWPELALANHSCMPNAAFVLVAGRMVLTALTQLLPGEQVEVNYLGAEALQPLARRRRLLAGTWGFTCACPRCRLEEQESLQELGRETARANKLAARLREEMQAVMRDAHARAPQRPPDAQDESTALARGQQLPDDVAALAQELGIAPPSERPWTSYNTIQPSLRAMRGVKQQHGAGGPPPDDGAAGGDGEAAGALGRVAQRAARAWARLGRLAQASEEVRRAPPSALQQLLAGAHALQDVIASLWVLLNPGSQSELSAAEALVFAASCSAPSDPAVTPLLGLMAAKARERHGVSDRATLQAEGECVKANAARYGPLPMPVMQRLVNAGIAMAQYASEELRQGRHASLLPFPLHLPPPTLLRPDVVAGGGAGEDDCVPAWAPPAWQWEARARAAALEAPPEPLVVPAAAPASIAAAAPTSEVAGAPAASAAPATKARRRRSAAAKDAKPGDAQEPGSQAAATATATKGRTRRKRPEAGAPPPAAPPSALPAAAQPAPSAAADVPDDLGDALLRNLLLPGGEAKGEAKDTSLQEATLSAKPAPRRGRRRRSKTKALSSPDTMLADEEAAAAAPPAWADAWN